MMKDKEILKSGLKLVASQFQLITVILLFLLGTLGFLSYLNNGVIAGTFDWFFPFQVFGISIPTSLCSIIFVSRHELSKKEFITRCIIHLIMLLAIVYGTRILLHKQ